MQVVGIWFYEEDEADKVETLLHRILAAYPTTSTASSTHELVCILPHCIAHQAGLLSVNDPGAFSGRAH